MQSDGAFTDHGRSGAKPRRVEKPQAVISEVDGAFSTRATPEPGGRRAGAAKPPRKTARRLTLEGIADAAAAGLRAAGLEAPTMRGLAGGGGVGAMTRYRSVRTQERSRA